MNQKEANQIQAQYRRDFLQERYSEASSRTPAYSLRAFARSLNLDASTLSQYLNGKRRISEKHLMSICNSLDLDFIEFLTAERRYCLANSGPKTLDAAFFSLKSKWYYFAILELTRTHDFQPNIAWVAKTLGLRVHIVRTALERLFELGALTVDEEGQWRDTLDDVTFITSENMDIQAGRQHQKQLLELAAKSVSKISGDIKDHTSLTLAFDTELLPEIKLRVAEFRRDLNQFIQAKSKTFDSVYCAQINLFPLTDTKKNKKEIPND